MGRVDRPSWGPPSGGVVAQGLGLQLPWRSSPNPGRGGPGLVCPHSSSLTLPGLETARLGPSGDTEGYWLGIGTGRVRTGLQPTCLGCAAISQPGHASQPLGPQCARMGSGLVMACCLGSCRAGVVQLHRRLSEARERPWCAPMPSSGSWMPTALRACLKLSSVPGELGRPECLW